MNVTIKLDNGYLKLSDEFAIPLNFAIDDIRNLDKKNSAYSKTITIPGDKANNFLLGSLFDINSDFTFFNPNFKTNAEIFINSTSVLKGYLKLDSIKKLNNNDLQGNKIEYNITIFSETSNFFNIIGNKTLDELDFSEFNHIFNYTNISNSWSNTWDDGYVYPILSNQGNGNYETNNFTPSIFSKKYLEKIITTAGYQMSGSFFNSTLEIGGRFEKEIIAYNGGRGKIGQAEINSRKFIAGCKLTNNVLYTKTMNSTGSGSWAYSNFMQANPLQITQLDDDSNPPNFDISNVWDTTNGTYTVNKNGKYDLLGDFKFQIKFDSRGVDAYLKVFGGTQVRNIFNYSLQVELLKNNNSFNSTRKIALNIPPNGRDPFTLATIPAMNLSNGHIATIDGIVNLNFPNLDLTIGDKITLMFSLINDQEFSGIYPEYHTSISISGVVLPVDVSVNLLKITSSTISTNFRNEPRIDWITNDDDLNMNSFIAKGIKQKDLVIDLIKRYNLYIRQDSNNSKKLIIDTRNDFYNLGETIDWTDKKDYSSEDKIELLSELQNKEIIFTNKKGDDNLSKKYTDSVGDKEIYGQKRIKFDNEFVQGTKKIESPFSSALLTYDNVTWKNKIVPNVDMMAPSKSISVLYYGGLIATINSAYYRITHIDAGVSKDTWINQYPYAGHYDNPYKPTWDIHFGEVNDELFYTDRTLLTNNNMYNKNWSSYINQIGNGKMVTSKFNLNEVDIAAIKDNLNNKIFIKDTYYYINKIKDFDANSKKLTTVELLKIVEGIAFEGLLNQPSTPVAQSVILQLSQNLTSNTPTNLPLKSGVNNNINSGNMVVIGNGNYAGANNLNVSINGNNNTIDNNVINSGIMGGDNNVINSSVNNSWIIGSNNKNITQNNETWIGEVHIVNGVIQTNYNRIIGGVDELRPLFNASSINRIIGGVDELRDIIYTNPESYISGGVNSL